MVRNLKMEWKELMEARRAGIPERIVGKMGQGLEPTEKDKGVINQHGKAYVKAHFRNDGKWVKSHLRDLNNSDNPYKVEVADKKRFNHLKKRMDELRYHMDFDTPKGRELVGEYNELHPEYMGLIKKYPEFVYDYI